MMEQRFGQRPSQLQRYHPSRPSQTRPTLLWPSLPSGSSSLPPASGKPKENKQDIHSNESKEFLRFKVKTRITSLEKLIKEESIYSHSIERRMQELECSWEALVKKCFLNSVENQDIQERKENVICKATEFLKKLENKPKVKPLAPENPVTSLETKVDADILSTAHKNEEEENQKVEIANQKKGKDIQSDEHKVKCNKDFALLI